MTPFHRKQYDVRALALFFATVVACLGLGCATTASSNVKTSGFYAQLAVRGDSSASARAEAIFQVGGPTGTYIDLVDGDAVTCNGLPLDRAEILGMISYSRPMLYKPGDTYEFVLSRPGEPPYPATVTLPEAVVITSPPGGASFKAGDDLSVSWTPSTNSADSVALSVEKKNESDNYSESQSPDRGSDVVPGHFTATRNSPVTAAIRVTRNRSGTLPAALAGTAHAEQTREVDVTLTH